jgi:hypothetical protein
VGDVGAWVGKTEASGKEGMGCEGRGGGGGGEPKPRRGAPERGGAYLNGGIKPRIKQCLTHTTHDTHTPPPTRALRAYGLSARWAPGALRPPPTLTRGTRTLAWRRGGGEPFRAVPPAVWPRGNDRGALGRGRVSAARERGEASDARNGRNWRGSVAVSGLGPRRAPSGGPRGAGGGLAAKHGMGGRRRGARSRCSGDGGSRVSNARLLRKKLGDCSCCAVTACLPISHAARAGEGERRASESATPTLGLRFGSFGASASGARQFGESFTSEIQMSLKLATGVQRLADYFVMTFLPTVSGSADATLFTTL